MPPRPVAKPVKLVDINSASAAELMKLPGVSSADAERIVAGRPYRTSADLATNKVLPTGAYIALRRSIVAMPPRAAGGAIARSKAVVSRPADSALGSGKAATP